MDRRFQRLIHVSALEPQAFTPFGEVIQNPATHHGDPEVRKIDANQGSATKWLDVTAMKDYYHRAASRKTARVVFNMFVCMPRPLSKCASGETVFEVAILERHPYTPQTFIPLSLDRSDRKTCYLVIVAPTLPSRHEAQDTLRGSVEGVSRLTLTQQQTEPKGPGLPDLSKIQAFIARGDQCVTYGAGTWHAPMIVLGEREIEFVVVQHANEIANEDCQEVEIEHADNKERIAVLIYENTIHSGAITKLKL
nr:ureidoglycolate lyase [Quercus suber]